MCFSVFNTGGVPWETLTLTTLGRRRNILLQMLEEAKADVLARHAGTTSMYHCTGTGPPCRD